MDARIDLTVDAGAFVRRRTVSTSRQACLKRGLRIPEDLSLVGFGNLPLGDHFQVPLTTLRQPRSRLGSAAVAAMQQLLRGQRPEVKPLTAELIVRASTGARPATPPFRKLKAN